MAFMTNDLCLTCKYDAFTYCKGSQCPKDCPMIDEKGNCYCLSVNEGDECEKYTPKEELT